MLRLVKNIGAITVGTATIVAAIFTSLQYFQSKSDNEITGWWKFEFTVLASQYDPYKNVVYGYKIHLQEKNSSIVGAGEKYWENRKEIPYKQHTPISLSGNISGDLMTLSYKLKGSKRDTIGSIRLQRSAKSKLIGKFKGTAADVSGSVLATKLFEN